ncbi:type II toxin-antitoxin system PemK/MazF family toxin [Streptomyces sp. NPDC001982]|uniref:type II toxin-antitoxin system PemK/MazF family toxin n=1 Tax=Streptomyces sp. NPDC001982 TaxID=3154405 RepID=UPI003322CFA7
MPELVPVRGRIYMGDVGNGRKPWLVVSNNARNTRLGDCLAARITTSPKPDLPSIVELSAADPLVGRVLCDDIVNLYRDELHEDRGVLTPQTMLKVAQGLRAALAI